MFILMSMTTEHDPLRMHDAFRETTRLHALPESAFEVQHPLRIIWSWTLDDGAAGALDRAWERFYNPQLDADDDEGDDEAVSMFDDDRRYRFPPRLCPQIVAVADAWRARGIAMKGKHLQKWIKTQLDMSYSTCLSDRCDTASHHSRPWHRVRQVQLREERLEEPHRGASEVCGAIRRHAES
jgi:hypothetical protein